MRNVSITKKQSLSWQLMASLVLLLTVLMTVVCGVNGADASVAVLDQFPATPQAVTDVAATGTISGTVTVSGGANRMMIVVVGAEYTAAPGSQPMTVTYGGLQVIPIEQVFTGNTTMWVGYMDEYALTNASSTTLSVTNGTTTNLTAMYASAAVYSGVAQVAAFSGHVNKSTVGAATASSLILPTLNVVGAAGNTGLSVYVDAWNGQNSTVFPGYTQNQQYVGTNFRMSFNTGNTAYTAFSTSTITATPAAAASGVAVAFGLIPTSVTGAFINSCDSCHGYPPVDGLTRDDPAGQFPGSHSKHANYDATSLDLVCVKCHVNNTTYSHATGEIHMATNINGDVGATYTKGTTFPVNNSLTFVGGTCSGVSCHASIYSTASGSSPTWGENSSSGCVICHSGSGEFTGTGSAPASGSHNTHMAIPGASCDKCHQGVVADTNGGSFHQDGNIDVLNGYTANVTKHTFNTGYSGSCGTSACHANPYSAGYITTAVWGSAGGSCSTCHTGAGAFTGTGTGMAPTTGTHNVHILKGYLCNACHAGTVGGSDGGSFHGDGNIDVSVTGGGGGTYGVNVTKHTSTTFTNTAGQCSTSCHGTVVWGGTLNCLACHTSTALTAPNANTLSGGTITSRRPISTEFTQTSNHTRSRGAVTDSDCGVCHMEGIAATGLKNNSASPSGGTYHGNGFVELRDPDTGTTIIAQTFSGTPGTFANKAATPPAVFVRFERNLAVRPEAETTNYAGTTNTVFEVNSAIQVKHCLNCHDSNGASNTAAQITGGVAGKPFNATVALNPGGSVLNVKDQFQSSNRSYHPVLAKGNNAYAGGTRMKAPWNNATKSGTTAVYGPLITCWDCHAVNSATGTLTASTTHGSTVSGTDVVALRGNVYTAGTTSALNICHLCHAGYTSADSHGAGSAFATLSRTAMGGINNGCYTCHAGNSVGRTARPQSAADAHGYSTRSTGAAFTQTYQGYGFVRSERFYASTYISQPQAVGATTYSANCTGASAGGLCSGRTAMGVYTPGGKY